MVDCDAEGDDVCTKNNNYHRTEKWDEDWPFLHINKSFCKTVGTWWDQLDGNVWKGSLRHNSDQSVDMKSNPTQKNFGKRKKNEW